MNEDSDEDSEKEYPLEEIEVFEIEITDIPDLKCNKVPPGKYQGPNGRPYGEISLWEYCVRETDSIEDDNPGWYII